MQPASLARKRRATPSTQPPFWYAPRMAVLIRPAAMADVPTLGRVHYESWMAAYRGVMAESFLATLSPTVFEGYARPRLEKTEPGNAYLVAEQGGEVVGFTRAGPTRSASPTGDPIPDGFTKCAGAELFAIYLLPSAFGTGAGTALLRHAAGAMRECGHTAMCVWVLTANLRALEWYMRRGARAIAEAPITLANVKYPQTALLWKDLAAIR